MDKRLVMMLSLGLLGLALVPCFSGDPAPEYQPGNKYYRFVFDSGAYYNKPLELAFLSYPEMRKAGFDGVLIGAIDPDGWPDGGIGQRLREKICKRQNISEEAYIARTIKACEDNALDFWVGYDWLMPAPRGSGEWVAVLDRARKHARLFASSPRFKGFFYDEPYAQSYYGEKFMAAFKEWLVKKYAPGELQALGLGSLTNAAVNVLGPSATLTITRTNTCPLYPAYARLLQQRTEEQIAASAQGIRKKDGDIDSESFRKWLIASYNADELKKMKAELALREDTRFILPGKAASAKKGAGKPESGAATDDMLDDLLDEAPKAGMPAETEKAKQVVLPSRYEDNPVLFMEYEEFNGAQFASLLADVDTAVREVKPGATTIPVLSFMTILPAPFSSPLARIGRGCSGVSCDPYWDGSRNQGFWAKLMRNQARGMSFMTVSAGRYNSGPNRFARDLAIGMVHSPAIGIWNWNYASKSPPGWTTAEWATNYQEGNHDVMLKLFQRGQKIQQYLVPSVSIAKVALVYSERESMWDQAGKRRWPREGGFVANCHGLHCALAQLGIPYEPVFEELIDCQGLDAYEVVILPGISYLRPESIDALDSWVRNGGALIVLGLTGLRDRWGRAARQPASVAALTGVTGTTGSNLTCLSWSPAKGSSQEMVYSTAMPAAKYELAGARAAGSWSNGAVAVALNEVGRGKVISFGAERLGLCDSGASNTIVGLLGMAAGIRRDEWVLQAVECPKDTEVTVRGQPGRYVVHLINYFLDRDAPQWWNTGATPVHDARVKLRLPIEAGNAAAAFYPEDMSRAELSVNGRDVQLVIRDFDVLETVVVQYDGHAPKLNDPCPGAFVLPPPIKDDGQKTVKSDAGKRPGLSELDEIDDGI